MSETHLNKSLIEDDLLLSATNISHKFDYELFHDISLTLQKQQSIAIIGMSGSGVKLIS